LNRTQTSGHYFLAPSSSHQTNVDRVYRNATDGHEKPGQWVAQSKITANASYI